MARGSTQPCGRRLTQRRRALRPPLIAYFDTSAFVKLLVSEPGSDHVAAVWRAADSRVSSLLLYPETRAALGRAKRMGRMKAGQARAALETLWAAIDRVELGDALAQHAGDLAGQLGLRAYDAVHLASLEFVGSDDIVFLSADRKLADAARSLGFAVVEPRP